MKKLKLQFGNKKGFSIAEVLIALFVLAFGIMSAVFLMAGSMKDTMEARDLVVASMLSQEGTELVRNIRDNNVTEMDESGGATDGERDDPFEGFGDGDCIVNYEYTAQQDENGNPSNDFAYFNSVGVLDCGSGIDFQLYFNSTGTIDGAKFYSHNGGVDSSTKFRRKIILEEITTDAMYKVVSMVVWDGVIFPDDIDSCHFGQKCVYSETILTSWIHFE